MKPVVALCAILAIAACAKDPENIAAVDIGTGNFAALSCAQLAQQEVVVTQNLSNLSAQQRQAAQDDAFGVFLIGLPMGSMSGNDRETQIAVTRGQAQAIDQVQAQKGC